MEFLTLNAENREATKKGICRRLRMDGKIPAVLYGRKVESRDLTISVKELEDAIKKSRTRELFFDIQLGDGTCKAMMKDFQKDPMNGDFVHADFYALEMDRKITAKVNLSVSGIPKGVDMGGTLKIFQKMVTVRCLPDATPENIVVDIKDIGLGKTLYLKNVEVPEGVELIVDGNAPLAMVAVPRGAAVSAGAEE
ncbi:50S ribosomal protein L25 [Desulfobotulus mexicanus]|uniref:50S ribosomal protein L25 n=1 Tax=Desulfobotulus mexicanus TaxID=2586642 RepID=UPI0015D207EF|nr:50S ribosomal protein L25 [Desulfobotulus mexicanus]